MHCWWEYRLVRPLWKRVWSILEKLKMQLPYGPAIPLLGGLSEGSEISFLIRNVARGKRADQLGERALATQVGSDGLRRCRQR